MGSRILNITACCFVAVWTTALHGQGPDAQSVTQAVLDQHKSADPTNSARSLTGRSQEFDISKIPPRPARSPKVTRPSRKTSQRIRELEKKKQQFFKKFERQSTDTTFVPASRGASAPEYRASVLPAGTMRSASSAASTGRSAAALSGTDVPPAVTTKPAGSTASMERSRAAFNATTAQRKGNQYWETAAERKWEGTPDGKTLRRLKGEVKTDFDISDIPLPRSNPR